MGGNTDKKKPRQLFTIEEDQILLNLVSYFGFSWEEISKRMINRNPRQCKDRYMTYLNPYTKLGNWTQFEDDLIIQKYLEFGNKWVLISKFLPHRTDTSIKNRFNIIKFRIPQDNLKKKTISDIEAAFDIKNNSEPLNSFPFILEETDNLYLFNDFSFVNK